METKIISKRYAKAFFKDLKPDNWNNALQDIAVLKRVLEKKVISLLSSPITNQAEKDSLIEMISENLNLSEKWKNFFKILEKKNRINYITTIVDELEQIILFNQGKEKVTVILAREEKPETIKKIEKKISEIIKKEIVMEIVLDPSIIGGFIAKTESLTINGSIKGNLIRLKKLIEE